MIWSFILYVNKTRHASKGVISLILPDELRPYCKRNKEPIDYIYNPFGVFSRMNLSQLLEVTCAKPTWEIDRKIKSDPKNTTNYLKELNETVIRHLGDLNYYERINKFIDLINKDKKIKKDFIEGINRTNLYIEVPSFTKINLRTLLKTATPNANEDVVIPKKLINFMKNRLNCFKDLNISDDIVLPNIFVGPIYVQKLYKIVNKLITYRDFGPLKFVTQQPVRGRAMGGGSSLGQMELESIMSSGCDKAVRELFTVKNDFNREKKKLLQDLIKDGRYSLPEKIPEDSSRTKIVINTLLGFLKK